MTASDALYNMLMEGATKDFLIKMEWYNAQLLEQAIRLEEDKYEKLFYMEDIDAMFVGEEDV